MANEILNMELSKEDEALLRESLTTWKESVYSDLLEEVEELKSKKIEELEEANRDYQSELKEEFANRMVNALDEMRSDLRAEVISEMVSSNPELQILEKVKELIAPTLNEEYYGNVFAEEIQTLREENERLNRQMELEEGAQKLAELLAPYSRKTQNIILAMIKEGNSEEVTEQFYDLIESLEEINEDDEDDEEEDDEDDDFEDDDFEDDDEEDDVDEGAEEGDDGYIKEDNLPKKRKGSFMLNEINRMSR